MKKQAVLAITLSAMILTAAIMPRPAPAADAETLDRLERLIQQQQAQIEAQRKAIEDLKRQVEGLKAAPPPETAAAPAAAAR